MFSALDICALGGNKVAVQFADARLVSFGIIHPFLLRVGGDDAKGRARSSAGALPLPITARVWPE